MSLNDDFKMRTLLELALRTIERVIKSRKYDYSQVEQLIINIRHIIDDGSLDYETKQARISQIKKEAS